MVATLVGAWAAKSWRDSQRGLWNTLVGWAVACSVVMFPVAALLWKFLPKLEFMQFPWRWLLCLSLIFSIFVTVGVRRWWLRAAICLAAILVIAIAWRGIQPPWWDNVGDLHEMQDNMATGSGYEGTDEYTPAGADPTALSQDDKDKDARKATVDGPAHSAIRIVTWGPRVEDLRRGNVRARSIGDTLVSVSSVASRSEWPDGGNVST